MFKSKDGYIYAGDCQPGDREATPEEIEAAKPNPIIDQIASIEATITPRRMREAALTDSGKAWLSERDSEISALRAKL